MRKMTLVGAAVLVALAVVLAGTAAVGFAARKIPLTCNVQAIDIVGKTVKVTRGGCKYGNNAVPAKYLHWTYSYSSQDVDGVACGSFGHASGTGSQAALPEAPKGVSGAPSPAMPGIFKAAFTVTAKYKFQTKKASLTYTKKTPNTRVLCGSKMPQLVPVALASGAQPNVTWRSNPSYSNGLLKAGSSINAVGLTNCQWHTSQQYVQNGYLVAGSTFSCNGGYAGFISYVVAYYNSPNHGATVECQAVTSRARTFPASTTWGPNWLWLSATINLTKNGQFVQPTSGTSWSLLTKNPGGTVDPCPIAR